MGTAQREDSVLLNFGTKLDIQSSLFMSPEKQSIFHKMDPVKPEKSVTSEGRISCNFHVWIKKKGESNWPPISGSVLACLQTDVGAVSFMFPVPKRLQ